MGTLKLHGTLTDLKQKSHYTLERYNQIEITQSEKTCVLVSIDIKQVCAREYPTRAITEAIETALHRVYASKRIRGEWFNLDLSDIEDVKNTLK